MRSISRRGALALGVGRPRCARRDLRATLNRLQIRPPSHGAGESLSSCSPRGLCILPRCCSHPCRDILSRVPLAAPFPVFLAPNRPNPFLPSYPPAITAARTVRAIYRTLRGDFFWRSKVTPPSFFLCCCGRTICEPRALEAGFDDVG